MSAVSRRKSAANGNGNSVSNTVAVVKKEVTQDLTWGREKTVSYATAFGCLFILITTPVFTVYTYTACTYYQCSLTAPIFDKNLGWDKLPQPSALGFIVYIGWLLFQGIAYAVVPAKIGYGQRTPAGYLLPYKVNGLTVWVITHALFLIGSLYLGWFPASIIADLWGPLLVAANVYGYFLTAFAYIKALYFPSHPEDRKFSGSVLYDIFMGVEFNPRFGELWDFKLFHNGRPGIVAWTLIDISFAAAQYQKIGYVTNSMVLLNILHALYVLDFFYNEDWYLRTIDIAHDHFGFYLAWGDSVWLPWMYTLQAHYLLRNPVDLSIEFFLFVAGMGALGYWIFRGANHQKDLVRNTDANCKIWGKKPTVVRTTYKTSDGKTHHSLLLASGYWGLARQFNYCGDLLISLAECLCCAFGHPLPYFYIVYMTILLVHRVERGNSRANAKYGDYWAQYCKLVPYKIIPGIY